MKENLNYTGNDELWLQKQLVSQGFDNINDVFLATCDSNNNLSVFSKKDFNNSHDIFELKMCKGQLELVFQPI